jgi:hypothetical protein
MLRFIDHYHQNLLRMMELDVKRMREYLPADRLPDLIEHNQTIATEALDVLAPLPEFSESVADPQPSEYINDLN